MSTSPDCRWTQVPLDSSGNLDLDLTCVRCAYNLRGLRPEGICPECGTAVARSCQGNSLRFCDPNWVEQLASGMRWVVASIVLGILLGLLAGGVSAAMGGAPASIPTGALPVLIGLAAGILSIIGYWKVTTPEPGVPEEPAEINLRKVIRVTLILGFLLNIADIPFSAGPLFVDTLLALVSGVVGLVMMFSVFVYARRLALRIPDLSLAKSTRTLMWLIVVIMLLAIVLAVVGALVAQNAATAGTVAPGAAPPSPGSVFGSLAPILAIGCFVGVGYLVAAIWALLLINRYRKAFRQAASDARDTWARQVSAPGASATTLGS